MTQIFKVIQQGETRLVDSQKTESGKISKCTIVLQEFGGKFENKYVAVMLGNMATCKFFAGDIVVAKLLFKVHGDTQQYQDILVQEIQNLTTHL